MNATYLAVSIPLLLVMVGLNHAHGLTTFGKSSGNQPTAHPPPRNEFDKLIAFSTKFQNQTHFKLCFFGQIHNRDMCVCV